MIILGIDPGSAIVGFAVIKKPKNKYEKPKVIDFGCILAEKSQLAPKRLKTIYNEINKLIKKHRTDIISVESLYFFKNLKTAIPVSQSKGVILLAAANKNIPVFEFTPLQVKMTVAGYGRAEKKQVQEMTKKLLDISGFNLRENGRHKDDATDALGVALCAIHRDLLFK